MEIEVQSKPTHGWTHLGNGDYVAEGLYTEETSIPEESEAKVIQTQAGNFKIVEASPQQ